MSLTDTVREDMVKAAKEGASAEADILKVVLASLKNAKIEKNDGSELTEEEEVKVVFGEAKKVRDSFEQYTDAGRKDLAKREEEQLAVVERYLPEQAGEAEIRKEIEKAIEKTGAANPGQMGMVMAVVMKELEGKADGKVVSSLVREMLS